MKNIPRNNLPKRTIKLSTEDRIEIKNKIIKLIEDLGLDLMMMMKPKNFVYSSGIILPYAERYIVPKTAHILNNEISCVICPFEWQQVCEDQGNINEVKVYSSYGNELKNEELARQIAETLKKASLSKAKIGLDISEIPVKFFNLLCKELPEVRWIDNSIELEKIKMIKTQGEIALIEEAARLNDRATVAALNHSEGCVGDLLSYSIWELAERVRVHIGEFGGSGCGALSVLQGNDLRYFFGNSGDTVIVGNPIRIESTAHNYGYWTQNCRTLYAGNPPADFVTAYEKNINLKKYAVEHLIPGKRACDIFGEIRDTALKENILFIGEFGAGHGVGTSEREAPYLCADDDTVIEKGMVIVLAVYTYGPNKEMICSKDTYLITDKNPRLLSWYKNYDKLYTLVGTTARHG